MAQFKSLLLKGRTYITSGSAVDGYAHQFAVWHEFNNFTNQYILWGEDFLGSGSLETSYRIISIAQLGCNPVSFADNNFPTIEISEENSNLLATASIDDHIETIVDWLENNYFYHESSPATASVEIMNDISDWLLSGSLCTQVGSIELSTSPRYEEY